jgi:hypothetical protein
VPHTERQAPLYPTEDELVIRLQSSDPKARVVSPSPPPELSLLAFQNDICLSFMFSNYVWRSSGVLWLEDAASGKFGLLSLKTTYALSRANFGRSHHQPDIERQGIVVYGQCLTSLAGQLTTQDKTRQALIVPMLVLLLHAVSSISGHEAQRPSSRCET